MEILGIGPAELFFIILIAIIVLGPKDMQKAGRSIGRFLNQLVRSDSWKVFQKTSAEIRNLPRNLMREANMELEEANAQIKEMDKEIRQTIDPRPQPPASPVASSPLVEPGTDLSPSNEAENIPQAEQPPIVPTPEDDTNKHD